MKRKLSVAFLACVLALTLAFGLTACKKGGEGGTSGETPSGAITLDKTSVSLTAGGSSATVSATTASSGDTVTWSIADDSVATITPLKNICLVKPVKAGETTLTATVGSDKATCKVTVSEAAEVETVTIYNGETVKRRSLPNPD